MVHAQDDACKAAAESSSSGSVAVPRTMVDETCWLEDPREMNRTTLKLKMMMQNVLLLAPCSRHVFV
jgi:hypothetical protein